MNDGQDEGTVRRAVREQVVKRAQQAGGRIDPAAAKARDGAAPPVDEPTADEEPPRERVGD